MDGEPARPRLPGQHAAEQFQHAGLVQRIDQKIRRIPSQNLGSAVAEQALRLRAPQDDPSLVVEYGRRYAQQVQQATGWGDELVALGTGRAGRGVVPVHAVPPVSTDGTEVPCSTVPSSSLARYSACHRPEVGLSMAVSRGDRDQRPLDGVP